MVLAEYCVYSISGVVCVHISSVYRLCSISCLQCVQYRLCKVYGASAGSTVYNISCVECVQYQLCGKLGEGSEQPGRTGSWAQYWYIELVFRPVLVTELVSGTRV